MLTPFFTHLQRLALALLFFILLFIAGSWALRGDGIATAQAALTAAPDLIVSSITLSPAHPGAGDIGEIAIVVKNQGDAPAAGFHTYLYVDPATVLPTAHTTTTSELFFDVPLLPGGVYTWTRTDHPFTQAEPRIYVWVDPPWEDRVVEANEQNNLFPQPAATITRIAPDQATAGEPLTVTVTASNSHFLTGVTIADFGPGITVAHMTVLSDTVAQLALTLDRNAPTGPRLVALQTDGEVALGVHRFTVQPAATPQITALTPNHGAQGAMLMVTIQATHTHFLSGATTADFGPAIAVQAVTVTTPSRLQVKVRIDGDAMPGIRTITVTTPHSGGQEIVRRLDGFTVESAGAKDATLAVAPSPVTLLVDRIRTLDIVVTPGKTPVNGVQIHGKVDPTYLQLMAVISRTTGLSQVMAPPHFDPVSGEFTYAVGALGDALTEPFVLLSLKVKAKQVTPAAGAAIAFLNTTPATDITGPNGTILRAAYDGLVHVTDDAVGATLLGQVDLQGRPAKPHPAWSVPLTLVLSDLDNSELPALRERVTTDEQGLFTLADLPIGRYHVRVKGDHTLGSAIAVVGLEPGDNRLYLGTLLEGDVEHDRSGNSITTVDFGLLSGSLNKCDGDVGYVANADLDETDDCVTGRDAALLAANFNMAGDRTYASPDKVPAPLATGAKTTAQLRFSPFPLAISQTLAITGELYTVLDLPLYVDPGQGDAVLAVTGHYTFDAALLEVMTVDLSANPATLLLRSQVDNHLGTVRFQLVMAPDQAIDESRQIATLKVRLKQMTTGTTLHPVQTSPDAVDLAGANGSVLLRAESITLVSPAQSPIGAMENSNYLPIIAK